MGSRLRGNDGISRWRRPRSDVAPAQAGAYADSASTCHGFPPARERRDQPVAPAAQ